MHSIAGMMRLPEPVSKTTPFTQLKRGPAESLSNRARTVLPRLRRERRRRGLPRGQAVSLAPLLAARSLGLLKARLAHHGATLAHPCRLTVLFALSALDRIAEVCPHVELIALVANRRDSATVQPLHTGAILPSNDWVDLMKGLFNLWNVRRNVVLIGGHIRHVTGIDVEGLVNLWIAMWCWWDAFKAIPMGGHIRDVIGIGVEGLNLRIARRCCWDAVKAGLISGGVHTHSVSGHIQDVIGIDVVGHFYLQNTLRWKAFQVELARYPWKSARIWWNTVRCR